MEVSRVVVLNIRIPRSGAGLSICTNQVGEWSPAFNLVTPISTRAQFTQGIVYRLIQMVDGKSGKNVPSAPGRDCIAKHAAAHFRPIYKSRRVLGQFWILLLPLFGGSTPGGSVVDPWNCGVHGDSVEACFVGVRARGTPADPEEIPICSVRSFFGYVIGSFQSVQPARKFPQLGFEAHVPVCVIFQDQSCRIVIAYHTVVFDVKTSALPLDTENGVGLYLTNAFMCARQHALHA